MSVPGKKVYRSAESLAPTLEAERDRGARIVMCHGVFDILHPGHLAHLSEAKACGDILVVSVTDDPFVNKGPGKPIFPLRSRMQQLAALEVVDYVVGMLERTNASTITSLKPHLYVRGAEYLLEKRPLSQVELEACSEAGAQTHFTTAPPDSSTRISARAFSLYPEATERWLADFKNRHSGDEVLAALDRLSEVRLLVVAHRERVVLKYVEPFAQIPESYSTATRLVRKTECVSAGQAVLNHALGFVAEAEILAQKVAVTEEVFIDVDDNRHIFTAHQRSPEFWLEGEEDEFAEALRVAIHKADVVALIDYGLGLVTPAVQELLETRSSFLGGTVKAYHANFGFNDASKYTRMDYFCLSELEYDLALKNSRGALSTERVMIMRGSNGAEYCQRRAPSLAVNVIDTIGCGDSIFALTAPLAALETEPEIVNFVGQAIAAIQCKILQNTKPVDAEVLRKFIGRLLA